MPGREPATPVAGLGAAARANNAVARRSLLSRGRVAVGDPVRPAPPPGDVGFARTHGVVLRLVSERAAKAASVLTGRAEESGAVVLVGHGLMNILIARRLRATGWRGPRFPSPQYWTFGSYERNNDGRPAVRGSQPDPHAPARTPY